MTRPQSLSIIANSDINCTPSLY